MGTILNNPQIARDIAQLLECADFEMNAHQEIFGAMVSLLDDQVEVDEITLASRLEQMTVLEKVGRMDYLTALKQASPSAVNAKPYARIIRDSAKNRILKQLVNEIAIVANEKEKPEHKVKAIKDAVIETLRLLELHTGNDLHTLAHRCLDQILSGSPTDDQARKIKTGFDGIDSLLEGGLESGKTVLVTGNGGQTSLCLNVVENIGAGGLACLVLYAAGHSPMEITQTLLARLARVPYVRLKNRVLSDNDVHSLEAAIDRLSSWDIQIKAVTKADYLTLATLLHGKKPAVLLIDCAGSESGQDMVRIARDFGVAVLCSAADTESLKVDIDQVLDLQWKESTDRNAVTDIFVCRAGRKTRLTVRRDMMLFAQSSSDLQSITKRDIENAESGLSAVQ